MDIISIWGGVRIYSQSIRALMRVLEKHYLHSVAGHSAGYDFGDELQQIGAVLGGEPCTLYMGDALRLKGHSASDSHCIMPLLAQSVTHVRLVCVEEMCDPEWSSTWRTSPTC